ncbi:MAG: LytR/AlgR family response regulator transcription factor [Faecalibacterium sp.]
MRILVCDDDAAFGQRIAGLVKIYLEARGVQTQCDVYTSGEQALARQDTAQIQAAFLDVDMLPLDGISLGRELKRRNPGIMLVFVSAYLEFAPAGYTVSAFRYLLKKDVERTLPVCLDEVLMELADNSRTLSVRMNREVKEIPLERIYYLESDLRKVNVYGDVPHTLLCSYYGKLADLPDFLFENGFLKVGRSYVVNMFYIQQIKGYQLRLANGVELSVSRNGYAGIRNTFLEWKGQFANE